MAKWQNGKIIGIEEKEDGKIVLKVEIKPSLFEKLFLKLTNCFIGIIEEESEDEDYNNIPEKAIDDEDEWGMHPDRNAVYVYGAIPVTVKPYTGDPIITNGNGTGDPIHEDHPTTCTSTPDTISEDFEYSPNCKKK